MLALDELPQENSWLKDFFGSGLRVAYAEHVFENEQDFNRVERKVSYYDFENSQYHFEFELTHTADWSVLTKNGTVDPPKMSKQFASSKVSQWTNFKGEGTYKETYSRAIPNWLYFKGLDSLTLAIAAGKIDPAINKLLWSDEQKIIRKFQSAGKSEDAVIWKQFDYDHKGNIIGIATDYLSERSAKRNFESRLNYEVYLENKDGERLLLKPVTSEKGYFIIDGVQVSLGDKSMLLFNESLNNSLHRFCPDVFRNPQKVLRSFLLLLQETSGKKLSRFSEE